MRTDLDTFLTPGNSTVCFIDFMQAKFSNDGLILTAAPAASKNNTYYRKKTIISLP
jgi:hypothetical protein